MNECTDKKDDWGLCYPPHNDLDDSLINSFLNRGGGVEQYYDKIKLHTQEREIVWLCAFS